MFSDPNTIVPQLPIPVGASVADLGAGIGAYSLLIAKKIGPTGKVYACEVQKDLLVRLENEARAQGVTNIQTVHANIEVPLGTKLRDQSIDWVLIANTLFQVEHRSEFIREIARILKPGGAVCVIDWQESFGNMGPHDKDVVNATEAERLFAEVGFHKAPATIDAGAHHYGILFRK